MARIVVTGASTGVGKACARLFAGRGDTVAALARNELRLEELREEAPEHIHVYSTDVSSSAQVQAAFDRIDRKMGGVDVLINNAGVVSGKGGQLDFETIDRLVDTNLKGTMYCTAAALPIMRRQKKGSIINVASIAGVDIAPRGNIGIYGATKHAVVAFSDSLGRLVRKDGILITTLCPGGIDTPLWNERNPYPLGTENMIRPEEVADLIAYVLAQPRRTLFKNVVFIPTVEEW